MTRHRSWASSLGCFLKIMFVLGCLAIRAEAQQWNTSGNNIYNGNSGNVGVGTTSPATKLDVSGGITTRQSVIYAGSGPGGDYPSGDFWYHYQDSDGNLHFGRNGWDPLIKADRTSNDVIFNLGTGKVGIGTTSPQTPLHVYSNTTYGALILQSGSSASYAPRVYLQDDRNGGRTWQVDSGAYAGQFSISDNTIGLTRLTINASGNVGIGVTNPASKLHVDGDVTVSGNISAKYQDVAEWVPTSQTLSSGSVVVLRPGHGNSVARSTIPYDTRVAGVVSSNPGIVLGEGGEGKVRVATTGRVKVRVDASSEPIEVGDLLVTGFKEGTAMKSQPVNLSGIEIHRPGTLIGKALEPLSEGEGEILVLLSLQ